MKKVAALLAFLGLLLVAAPAQAQGTNSFLAWLCRDATANQAAGWCPVSSDYPMPIAGTFSASLGTFAPGGAYATLAVGGTSTNIALPGGTTVVVYNTGVQNAYVALGLTGATTATMSQDVVPAGGWMAFARGSNGFLAAITSTGTTTLTLSGGSGLPAGISGASSGGGGGGNVNIAQVGGNAVTTTLPVSAVQSGSWTTAATQSGTWTVSATQSGTWNLGNITGTITLPTGAATLSAQTGGGQKTQLVDSGGNVIAATSNALNITGPVTMASGAAVAGALVDGASVTTGAKADVVCASSTGTCTEIALLKYANTQLASLTSGSTVNIGSIGGNAVTTTLPVSGTVAATQSGTWNVGITGTPNVSVTNTPSVNATIVGTPAVTLAGGTVSATSAAAYTDRSVTIATGGTSQQLMASNGSRKGFMIRNPASAASQGVTTPEPVFVNWGTAAVVNGTTSWELLPGESLTSQEIGLVSTQQITVIGATTGHVVIAKEM